MKVRCLAVRWVLTTVVSLAGVLGPLTAAGQEEGTSPVAGHDPNAGDSPNAAAGTHFRRGVQLYNEADYAGALVEFKRAYSISPTSAALYNVGEAQYQLQDYASALKTFQRFLAEFGPAESRRGEVERSVEVLRTRVGRVTVTTLPVGADISVDDHFVGKTPLNEPLLVSVGRRKLSASMNGRTPVVSYVDVAAEDEIPLKLELAAPAAGSAPIVAAPASEMPRAPAAQPQGSALPIAGFVFTGALAAGAATFGVLALEEENTLKNARNAFPAVPATVSHDANLTTTFSILADSLGASAIVVGVVSLIATLSSANTDGSKSSSASAAGVVLGPASARLEVTF
jgi:PEGA domain-containing protein